jgi:hypothetical protein
MWVAGLLEGEGCFTRKSSGTARNIVVTCHMTDLDVLEKLVAYVGAGYLLGPYKNGQVGNKVRWVYNLHGLRAYHLMKTLLPHMSSRRQIRISQLLQDFDAVPTKKFTVLQLATGAVHTFKNMERWCRERKLISSNLYRTMKGERQHHKGYRRLT